MFNYLLGIGSGIFIAFGGSKFFIFMKQVLKDRREKEQQRAEETMELIVDKIIDKKMENK